jgi:APA family basic amino acid/polyamine antiporter
MSGLFVLRKKRPDLERPFKAFGYPVVPAAYIVVAAMIALDLLWMKPTYSWLGLILVLSGVPVFFFWHSRTKDV